MAEPGHAERVLSVLRDGAATPLAASWRRSLTLHQLDPENRKPPETLSGAELKAAQEQMGPLLAAAQDNLDALFQAVGDGGCCVLLTNADGVPVDRRGVSADDPVFRRWGLWNGAVWSEAREGTNGIGTCLAEQRVLTIHRDQHFHTRNIGLSCTVAPLFDPNGRIAGALDVSSCRPGLDGLTGLVERAVTDAARRIEARAFREAFPGARIVLLPDTAADRASVPMLAVDADDVVIGATRAARLALKLTDETLKRGLPSPDRSADLDEAERAAVRRALTQAGGNVSAAAGLLGLSRATLNRKLKRLDLARGREFH
ncbi:sigma-54-dependent Fis family transcriptional regulator [Caulobacter vibrioides]|uniref:GAF domain-containing protein n=1 Tax=Caulobacter vibrioides TaxID=155892 RepID=UPI000BB4A838|nr:GAF domain-containing protein [Caulobacter vibrioides]ATC26434.1 sigma-54-dependent Fis family transcriptional regulator [Caulobacter vibrioides]AZH14563.1 sigma-54-dependent Fis family transcriptional regulator [Caulobacter vibrioides]